MTANPMSLKFWLYLFKLNEDKRCTIQEEIRRRAAGERSATPYLAAHSTQELNDLLRQLQIIDYKKQHGNELSEQDIRVLFIFYHSYKQVVRLKRRY
jgi:DNA-binding MarR family transcriptional regulator